MHDLCDIAGHRIPADDDRERRLLDTLRQARAVLASCQGTSPSAERRRREIVARIEDALLPAPAFVATPEGAYGPPLPGIAWG